MDPQPLIRTADLPAALPAERCPVTLYLANDLTTEVSRRGMFSNLRRAVRVMTAELLDEPRLFPWWRLEQAHVARLRTMLLEDGAAPATVNTILCGVRGVLKQCWRLELVDAESLARATDVKPARGSRVDRKGRALTDGEIRALFVACADDDSAAGVRDAAVFALLLGAGLRRAEVSSLRVDDYRRRPSDGVGELIVRGKGNQERRVYIHRGAQAAVEDWLALRGAPAGSLFVPVDRTGQIHVDGGFQGQSLAGMVRKRALQAGLAPFTPHDCRRTFISRLLDLGKDISTVADLAGHASVETTRSYDRRGERAAIEAAQAVHIPYRGRG